MDAPNAPNPANPNVQDQNVYAAQGPANQNQAQVHVGQIPTQGPAVQIPVQGPAQVVKIYPSNHYNNWSLYNQPLLVL